MSGGKGKSSSKSGGLSDNEAAALIGLVFLVFAAGSAITWVETKGVPFAERAAAQAVPAVQQGVDKATSAARQVACQNGAAACKYDRDAYGVPWTDDQSAPLGHNGWDTRSDVLRAQTAPGTTLTTRKHKVVAGTVVSAYTGRRISVHHAQIDHTYSLKQAWPVARAWDQARREAFANDPRFLVAVEDAVNVGKSDDSPAEFAAAVRSARATRKGWAVNITDAGLCSYQGRYRAAAHAYGLPIPAADGKALDGMKARCPGR